MGNNNLVRMANQIARNLEVRGTEEAVSETASHIIKFWDPRMKAAMLAGDRSQLSPLAAEAVKRVEAHLAAQPA
jgi:formate dehydrogenase subunit delta